MNIILHSLKLPTKEQNLAVFGFSFSAKYDKLIVFIEKQESDDPKILLVLIFQGKSKTVSKASRTQT